jgi:hypothetical protein
VDTLNALPGVTSLWRAEVTSVGKYGFFRPAARTPGVAPPAEGFAHSESAGE